MPARTRKIRHDDETRAKIQAALLIRRMMDCVSGKITLDAQQVSCAKALLAKVLPDLQTIQGGNTPIKHDHTIIVTGVPRADD